MEALNIPSIRADSGKFLKTEELIINSIEFNEGSSFDLLGLKIDKFSLMMNTILICIVHAILYYLDMLKDIDSNQPLFYMYIFLWFIFFFQIKNASIYSGNVQLELSNVLNINQSISLFLGSLVILICVLKYLKPTIDIQKYLLIILLLMLISLSINYEQIDKYRIQNIRYYKEFSLNFIKWLFAFFIMKDFFGK